MNHDMRVMRRLVFGFLLALSVLPALGAHTQVRLVLSHESARPGEVITAGIHLKMDAGWHTYWRNGGDSGAPTSIEWTLPQGVTAGDIQWPLPEKLDSEGLFTFVYHKDVVLLVPLTVGAGVAAGEVEFKAKVSWLECEKLCVTGNGDVTARLNVGDSKASSDAKLISDWKLKIPAPKSGLAVRAGWENAAKGDSRPLLVEWTAGKQAKSADFFPYESEKFMVKAATEPLKAAGGATRLRLSVEKLASWPTEISGVLVELGDDGKPLGAHEVTVPVKATLKAAASDPASASAPISKPPEKSLLLVLAAAFLGGLIMNLMPCVLPVLALKVLSFVQQSQESPAHVRKLSLVYAAGVVISFLILAGIAISIRAAQGSFSWGQQFQNPQFLIVLTTLVMLVALNLFGVFEVALGSNAMSAASVAASREGAGGAFFNGVLAVVLGTSCTAPFLGLALGYALYRSPLDILLTFLMVGVGLAFPYVALSFSPALRRFLPKPGMWMERFKVALGFPVLATAVWLLSLLTTHFGNAGVLWVGLFLTTVAVAAWIFGQFVQRGTQRKGLAAGLAFLLLLAGGAFALEARLQWRSPPEPFLAGVEQKRGPDEIDWRPWSAAAVDAARAASQPAFVDFTADWCLNCQVNKKSSIDIPSVKKRLKEIKAVSLLGDFTRQNKEIAAELKRHGRAGVPLVLVYPADATKSPIVLPELLTPSIVLEALDQAVK